MYSINEIKTGAYKTFKSYDDAIEYLIQLFGNSFTVTRDVKMIDVWWISINKEPYAMLTSRIRAFDVHVGPPQHKEN